MSSRRDSALASLARLPKNLGHYINGRIVEGEGTAFDVLEPATGAVLGQATDATAAELDAAVGAAKAAFPAWAATSGKRRKEILHKIADLIEARAEEIPALECLDTGQPWRFMSQTAIRGAEHARLFGERVASAADR